MRLGRKLFYLKHRLKHYSGYFLTIFFSVIFFSGLIFYLRFKFPSQQITSDEIDNKTVLGEDIVQKQSKEEKVEVLEETVNFLLLGLDGRKGDSRPRCDAIHMITFSPPEDKIIITSVPRGIRIDIEGIATPSAYIGNSCHIKGIDFAVKEITKMTKIEPDYVVKINFSQTLGVLRMLKMPTTPTLQFLRDRKSHLYGDNQRSHNQALFIKDMFVNHLKQTAKLPKSLQKIVFKIFNVEGLQFTTAEKIINWAVKNDFQNNSDKIELVIKPIPLYPVKDIHFQENNFNEKEKWQDDEEFQNYQKRLTDYLRNLIKKESNLEIPFSQQLWLQIENQQLRNEIHFQMLEVYVSGLENKQKAIEMVESFIEEMEMDEEEKLKQEAEKIIASLSEK